ncbi:hypothetical protein [Pedobacter insulae]|uniref:Uncharacterized protein n=1 Tax=Pedobacter insulae TaxID=414048 RepID=A0A1I2TI76_9SPHI|nr:hypothetical protein [Pedobacter insulae]SFG62041.1 hypothetical protein SAMN04489864_101292 [Pedobacter insulae]
MQVTLEINGEKAFSILDVLKSIKGVKIKSVEPEAQSEEAYLLKLKDAVEEVNQAKAGKVKLKTFDDLLSEI